MTVEKPAAAGQESGDKQSPRIAVVGACASGKSTLVDRLRRAGFQARHVAQEHSYVPHMWQRISRPDILIYLDVSFETILVRRPRLDFRRQDLAEQNRRLDHARQHCDLYLDTSSLTPDQVWQQTTTYLDQVLGGE
jgi:deoxyadenosine/deoxycytidine kinase